MKRVIILLAGICCCISAAAQEQKQSKLAQEMLAVPFALPEYVYCEICGYQGAGRNGICVKFDIGQPMTKKERLITDREGRTITFNSHIDALNYMACRGWELVQAYSAGEDNDFTCMLLRLPTSKLTEEQQQALLSGAWKQGD